MTTYIALLRKEAISEYGVDFPDFPGYVTAGRTLDEARGMAVEALDLHIAGMLQDGDAVPEPSGLDSIAADPASRDAVIVLVVAQTRNPKSVRVNIMLPEDLVQAIDPTTNNRSRFLAEAARAKLHVAA